MFYSVLVPITTLFVFMDLSRYSNKKSCLNLSSLSNYTASGISLEK